MPNEVIQFAASILAATNGVDTSVSIPIIVPDKMSFRVRYVEFRMHDQTNADAVILLGLSRQAEPTVRPGTVAFIQANQYIAYWSWGFEASGAAGLVHSPLSHKIDVWDLDYRLVMRPTFHLIRVGSTVPTTCVVAGQLVPSSQNERNAIIAIQGGAK